MHVDTILKMPHPVKVLVLTGVLAVVIVGFLAIRVIVNREGLDSSQSVVPTNSTVGTADLESQYQRSVQEIIATYLSAARVDDPNLGVVTTQAQDRLLALKVPASQRDNHLALVLDLDAIKIAVAENNSAAITESLSVITAQVEASQ